MTGCLIEQRGRFASSATLQRIFQGPPTPSSHSFLHSPYITTHSSAPIGWITPPTVAVSETPTGKQQAVPS
jgi:hypothetical protein